MEIKKIKKEIDSLKAQIRHHDHLYYVLSRPEISDSSYDELYKRLTLLEQEHPHLITPDSPTQRVAGTPREGFGRFHHPVPLLSLESLFTEEDAEAFLKRIVKDLKVPSPVFVTEPKFDGLSVEVIYKKGVLIGAGTRGDGTVGEDVTQNIRTIKSLPLVLQASESHPIELRLRGEVVMPVKGFERLNKKLIEEGEEPFANPRNAASGSLRQLDSRVTAERPLDLYIYGLLSSQGWSPDSHWETLETLHRWGFRVNQLRERWHSVKEILQFHSRLEQMRDQLDYEIDGIVVKLDRMDYQERLGARSRSPRWAIALKFQPRREITLVEDIVVQVGRQGTLTPVALLKPVEVSGVTVSRATLHNLDIMRRLDVRLGDEVKVARAGDVIPEVIEVNHLKRKGSPQPFEMPQSCPVCRSPVVREGAFYLCTGGLSCLAQVKWAIIHYASRRAMDIEGLGRETVDLLLKRKLIQHAADLYSLEKRELLTLEGFKAKKADNLLHGIEESKNRSLARFIFALGIGHVGEGVSRILADHFRDLNELTRAPIEAIEVIKGIGPEITQSIIQFFKKQENTRFIRLCLERGVHPRHEEGSRKKDSLHGKTFVLTGELESLSRSEAEAGIREMGGKTSGSVSKKTDYVVVGESPGSKHDKAKKLGIKILEETAFLNLIQSQSKPP